MPVNRSLADLNVPVGRSPNGQLGVGTRARAGQVPRMCSRVFMPREGDRVLSCALEVGHRQANLHRDPSCEEWISGEAFAGFDAFCAER